jgi:hypothetical protein
MRSAGEDEELAQALDIAPTEVGNPLPPSRWPSLATRGMALAALGAIAFSGKAIIVKLGYRHGADAVTLLALRMAVALLFLC